MKKVFAVMVALCMGAIIASAQTVVRNGKEYSVTQTQRTSEAKKTGYTWKDKDGNVYDIYISSKGACFIIRTSKKTGKEYRQYLPKDIQNEIKSELK